MANTVNVQLKSYVLETEVKVGARGKSAYESWLSQGNVGSEADFVNAMLQDATYIFEQQEASSEWAIVHNLNKFPAVTIVDSAETVVFGDVEYIDSNSLKVSFTAPFGGKAYLN
jgi:hypothetical protein